MLPNPKPLKPPEPQNPLKPTKHRISEGQGAIAIPVPVIAVPYFVPVLAHWAAVKSYLRAEELTFNLFVRL